MRPVAMLDAFGIASRGAWRILFFPSIVDTCCSDNRAPHMMILMIPPIVLFSVDLISYYCLIARSRIRGLPDDVAQATARSV